MTTSFWLVKTKYWCIIFENSSVTSAPTNRAKHLVCVFSFPADVSRFYQALGTWPHNKQNLITQIILGKWKASATGGEKLNVTNLLEKPEKWVWRLTGGTWQRPWSQCTTDNFGGDLRSLTSLLLSLYPPPLCSSLRRAMEWQSEQGEKQEHWRRDKRGNSWRLYVWHEKALRTQEIGLAYFGSGALGISVTMGWNGRGPRRSDWCWGGGRVAVEVKCGRKRKHLKMMRKQSGCGKESFSFSVN